MKKQRVLFSRFKPGRTQPRNCLFSYKEIPGLFQFIQVSRVEQLHCKVLDVAKCNLGKVKFKTMPVSGRPTLRLRGDLLSSLLGGASWFPLHLLACWPV